MLAILKDICPKQVQNLVIFFSLFWLFLKYVNFFEYHETEMSAERISQYGLPFSIFIYTLKMISLLTLPFNIQMILASLFYRQENLSSASIVFPKDRLCFRIVTRGDYPQLVKENVERILDLMKKFEFDKFLIEVVANKAIYLPEYDEKVRELVVPEEYTTKNGSKYKARYKI
jgi:egghead protein (zeste-white 4 protein)